MKTLILTRHAKTEQLAYNSSKSDFERALKPRGFNDATIVASDMVQRLIKPDLLITSTAKRAEQTTEIFAAAFHIDKSSVKHEQFLYDGYTTSELLSYLAQFRDQHECIMIVGHNPEIAMSAITLTDSDYLHFPTTGTIAIAFDAINWEDINAREGKIKWFTSPKLLK
ncbi:SixA phosphatase family protein [Carboxylicivirga taeanensis]|uniref:SixA phosphatase family protein n=1 Tax=Carboxylicivirga taeanensis TaxID=1416875 RepID=UPI003F6DE20F